MWCVMLINRVSFQELVFFAQMEVFILQNIFGASILAPLDRDRFFRQIVGCVIVYFEVQCSGFFYNDMIIQCVCIADDISAAIVPSSRQVVLHPSLPLKVTAAPRLSVTSSMKITRETMTTTAGLQCWSSAYGILHVLITATKYSMPFTFPSEEKKLVPLHHILKVFHL